MEENQQQVAPPQQAPPAVEPVVSPSDVLTPQETPKKGNKAIWFLGLLTVLVLLAVAYLAYQNNQLKKELMVVKLSNATTKTQALISPTEAITPTPDPTAGWSVYSNTKLGYKVKLPKDWVETAYSDSDNNFDFYKSENGLLVEILSTTQLFDSCRGACPVIESTDSSVAVAGVSAIKYEGYIGAIGGNQPHRYVAYEVNQGDQYINITFHASTDGIDDISVVTDISESDAKLFSQILSTFEFTDNNQTETKDAESKCISVSGIWLADYDECINITEEACYNIGGKKYNSCLSACRHDLLAETDPCITVCVQVCNL